MEIKIRLEKPSDYKAVESLTYKAFVDAFPERKACECDEHLLAHKLRGVPAFIPELDYVAEIDGEIIGNIMYSKAKVVGENQADFEVLTFGPVSVLPEYQNRKVGSELIRYTIAKAKHMGYLAILIFGHPEYYPRFGFKAAANFGIQTDKGENFPAFMALELQEGALSHVRGRLHIDDVFQVDPAELQTFNQTCHYIRK